MTPQKESILDILCALAVGILLAVMLVYGWCT